MNQEIYNLIISKKIVKSKRHFNLNNPKGRNSLKSINEWASDIVCMATYFFCNFWSYPHNSSLI